MNKTFCHIKLNKLVLSKPSIFRDQHPVEIITVDTWSVLMDRVLAKDFRYYYVNTNKRGVFVYLYGHVTL